jgi:hypothetical protein
LKYLDIVEIADIVGVRSRLNDKRLDGSFHIGKYIYFPIIKLEQLKTPGRTCVSILPARYNSKENSFAFK